MKEKLIKLTNGVELISPLSIHWEIGNAFSAMMKRKRITQNNALKAIQAYKRIPIQFVDIGIEEALRIASQLEIYAYDAYIICCAKENEAPIITLDRGLTCAAKNFGIKILEVYS